MDRRAFLRWLGIGVAVLPTAASAVTESTDITVLTGGTLIDGTGAPATKDTTIVLLGDQIAWTGPPAQLPHADGARVLDIRGKYVIPGLWDMHTHDGVDETMTLPLHIVNGVTSAREMWGFDATHRVRDRINRGKLLGPRFTIASPVIDGKHSSWPTSTQVVTADHARTAVRRAKAAEADFLKIYSFLLPEAYLALIDEARKVGLPFAGHQPARIPVRQVIADGMRSYEHLYQMSLATSRDEETLLQRLVTTPINPTSPRAFWAVIDEVDRAASLSHSPSKAADLYDRMTRANTWQCPTLTVLRAVSSPPGTFANDPRLIYIPQETRKNWADKISLMAPSTPDAVTEQRRYFQFQLNMINEMEQSAPRSWPTWQPKPGNHNHRVRLDRRAAMSAIRSIGRKTLAANSGSRSSQWPESGPARTAVMSSH
ncbi:amidohydrolase [Kibdelosporangium philippinense]|uniref:Amidohydrolase n=1 Tax=Kibdelosporangium philippinense TaxID=211113 RepID=A0ABS8ZMA8_9PSEU|nr:amidohydrolase [Kibdelosporangium philippinense]MCE7008911.1 amidohydrolase [Kibdelosporangium philippinense]